MKQATIVGDKIHLKWVCKSSEFQSLLAYVKAIKGRQFDISNKIWSIPDTEENRASVLAQGFTGLSIVQEEPIQEYLVPQADIDESLLPKGLREYQIRGVKFIEVTNGRCVLAFAPRLGKSLTALSWCLLHPENAPIIIICPASVKLVWEREVTKWCNYRYVVLSGRTPYQIDKRTKIIIINYDILFDWYEYLLTLDPRVMIVDEIHNLSNDKIKQKDKETGKSISIPIQRTTAMLALGSKIHHIIGLSGTPITKSPADFFTSLNMLYPKVFPNKYAYLHKYTNPTHNGYAWEYLGVRNVNELREKLSRIMFRLNKQDVFTELPEVQRILLPIEIDRKEYKKELEEFREWYKKNKKAEPWEVEKKLSSLNSISYTKKRKNVHEFIKEHLATGEKLVVFCWNRATVEDIYSAFKKQAVMVYGGMDAKIKQKAMDSFNNNEDIGLFVGNIKANKEGISLAGADTILFVELPFTPADLFQAEERIYLPDKKDQRLTYYYAVATKTIDEKRLEKLRKRAETLNLVLDGKDGSDIMGLSLEDLEEE